MSNILKKLCIFVPAVITANCFAAINPADLVKVTATTNPLCVEYYNYHNEMYCSTHALSATPVDPHVKSYDKQTVFFDDRAWQAVWGQQTASVSEVEYVPMGDNIDHWYELVTSQFFPAPISNHTAREFADSVINGIKQAGFNPDVTFIKDTPEQVIFEFQITSPTNQIQDELQMIRKTKDGWYTLHYTIKKADMGKASREQWLALIQKSKIK